MKSIESFNFSEKKAIMRVDFNVPLSANYEVQDDKRMRAALPSMQKILQDGGALVLMSHLGRPKTGYEEAYSLKHLVAPLSDLLERPVQFASDCIGDEAENKAKALKAGEVLLLENLRFHDEEKGGEMNFAEKLAKLGDIYVNDAFGTAHRRHASTAVIARFFESDKCFGFLMQKEIENGQHLMDNYQKPFTAIVGGAKVSDKVNIISNLIDRVDNLIIGGAMAYTFVKAQGGKVGKSLVEDSKINLARNLIQKALNNDVNILLPDDAVAADKIEDGIATKTVGVGQIPDDLMGLDIGPDSVAKFRKILLQSKTILWNGPMGVFEMKSFEQGTKGVAEAVAEATQAQAAYSLIGGGDSAAAIKKYGLSDKVSFVSTGGGAMLTFLEGKTLPGIAAIMD